MDDLPPTVFQPNDGEGEYAVVIDQSFDAILLRDAVIKAAKDARKKADKATQGHARSKNAARHEILQKYAERFEHVRVLEAQRITEALGLRRSSQG